MLKGPAEKELSEVDVSLKINGHGSDLCRVSELIMHYRVFLVAQHIRSRVALAAGRPAARDVWLSCRAQRPIFPLLSAAATTKLDFVGCHCMWEMPLAVICRAATGLTPTDGNPRIGESH